MRLYHLFLYLLLAAPAAQGQTPIPIVFDSGSLLRHRIEGEREVVAPLGAGMGWSGISVTVTISPAGEVIDARVDPRENFSDADPAPAIAAARGWRFRPFRYRDQPVAVRGSVSIVYNPPGGWRDPEAALPPIDYSNLSIGLTRSACLGACPDYAVTIDGAGNVTFSTRDPPLAGAAGVHREFSRSTGVLVPGEHRGRIDRATLDGLIERFRQAHFFGLKREYVAQITDNPSYQLTFESGGRRWTVQDYVGRMAGMPAVVSQLEDAVDAAAGTARWIDGDAGTVAALRAEGFDLHSLAAMQLAAQATSSQRTPDRLVLDLIAEVPLDRPFGAPGASAPLGEQLLVLAIGSHRGAVVTALAERGWLARLPRDRLSAAFAEGGGGCDPAIARALVAAGANPMARTRAIEGGSQAGGATALMMAVRPYGVCDGLDIAPLIPVLLELGVDANAANSAGETALFGIENPDLQEQLLALGARADVRDRQGNSPAFSSWNDRIVLGLLDAGADPNGHYYDGHDLRRQARERDMPSVLAWLETHRSREAAPARR